VPHDVRDQVVDFVRRWSEKTEIGVGRSLQPHQHWHIDVSYINVCATFYYLCGVLDGYSRGIVHRDLRESMKEADVEVILERAKEKCPETKPRIISDNGPQFIARDFKGVHSHLRHDARPNLTLLSAVERKAGALAQVTKERVHSAGNTAFAGRCPAPPERLRRALQQRLEQCHWLRHAEG
jgi:transposase InsO family protein